jgi:hypothetical protein
VLQRHTNVGTGTLAGHDFRNVRVT